MPAEIDQTTGSAAMVYNQQNGTPWHGLGTPVDGAMTGNDIFEMCPALDFEVALAPLYADISHLDPATKSVRYPRLSAIVRTDTGAPLGCVGDNYHILQNREVVGFADAIRGQSGAAYDTAMSLYGGRLVVFQLILGDDYEIKGDPSAWQRRLLVWSGHDGFHALAATRTSIRVVCANTYHASTDHNNGTYKVRHTVNMAAAIDEAQKALDMVKKADDSFIDAMTRLSRQKVTTAQVLAFTEALIPTPEGSDNPTRTLEQRETLVGLFHDSPTLVGVKPTAYRLLQATGEYADWYRGYRGQAGTKDEARAKAILDGTAQDIKARAQRLLLALAK